MSNIKRIILWPILGLSVFLQVACTATPIKLDTDTHTKLLQNDRQSLSHDKNLETISLSLEDAIKMGFEKNLDARVAALEELSQQNNITLAQLKALPGVDVSGGYVGRSNHAASSSESVLTRKESLEPSKSTEQNRRVASLAANWNLLDVAVALADAAKAKEEAGVSKERYQKVIQNIERDIYSAYWRALAFQTSSNRTNSLMANSYEQIKKIDAAAAKKLISSQQASEQISLLIERQKNLRDLNDRMQLADIELKSLLSIRLERKLILTTKNYDITNEISKIMSSNVSELEWKALKSRPEMREEILINNMAIRDTRREILQTFPGINFLLSKEYDSNKYLVDPNWTNFSTNIVQTITGLITLPDRYNLAKRKEAITDARRKALGSAIIAQVHMGRIRLSSMNESNIESQIALKSASRKSHAIAGKKMQGFASGLDKLISEMDLQIETIRTNMNFAELHDSYAAMRNTLGDSLIVVPEKIDMGGAR